MTLRSAMQRSLLMLCLVAVGADAQSTPPGTPFPKRADYAWGFPVVTSEEASFYTVRLPLDVNRSVTDPALRDAGVYNADGDPVPRVFKPASDDVEQIERSRSLAFVPLYGDTPLEGDEVHLLFERDGDRTRLELNSDAKAPGAARMLRHYIVDARTLDEAVEAVDLSWAEGVAGFIGNVTIEGSNDLRAWRTLGTASIADLREHSATILQRRVAIRPSSDDYLRLSWSGLPTDWSLAELSGVYTLGVPGIVRETIVLESDGTDPVDGGRIFTLGGAAKIDRLRLVLPQPNTVIDAGIYLWAAHQSRWFPVANGTHYHIGRGDSVVRSDAIRIPKTRSSRVKVVVTHGQANAPMQLEVGWRPDTLLFVAQGRGPFTLAAGRAADARDGFPQERRYGVRSITSLASGREAAATLGPRHALGGPMEWTMEKAIDWRKLALWLALALGVGFVGLMAVRILRDTGG